MFRTANWCETIIFNKLFLIKLLLYNLFSIYTIQKIFFITSAELSIFKNV